MSAGDRQAPSRWLLPDLASLLLILAAVAYGAGWVYAHRYFDHFQIGLLTLEVPVEYHFVYGFQVLWDWWWLWLAYLAVALRPWYGARLPTGLRNAWDGAARRLRPMLLGRRLALLGRRLAPLTLFLVFALLYQMAARSADDFYRSQRSGDFDAYPRVRVWLKPASENARLQALGQALAQGCHRLLLQNRGTLFLFKPPPPAWPVQRDQLGAVEVPMSEVKALRVLPQRESCVR